MSCSSCNESDCSGGCNPCTQTFNKESLASSLENLIEELFGTFTKTTVNGRSVWTSICSPNTDGIACFPKGSTEGFVCYFLRILDEIGLFNGGVWNAGTAYCKNMIVASGASLYVAITAVPAGTPLSNTTYWELLLTAPAGATGPQGQAGSAGSGSAVNYAILNTAVTVAVGDTDAVILCAPAGAMAVNLPSIASTLSGKWYKISTNGGSDVTITPNGADMLRFNGSLVATLVLSVAGSSVEIISNNAGEWRVL